jgi:hypothetical protein
MFPSFLLPFPPFSDDRIEADPLPFEQAGLTVAKLSVLCMGQDGWSTLGGKIFCPDSVIGGKLELSQSNGRGKVRNRGQGTVKRYPYSNNAMSCMCVTAKRFLSGEKLLLLIVIALGKSESLSLLIDILVEKSVPISLLITVALATWGVASDSYCFGYTGILDSYTPLRR